MVAAAPVFPARLHQRLTYLLLSLCINVWAINTIELRMPITKQQPASLLKVNLMARAASMLASAAVPLQHPETQPSSTPQPKTQVRSDNRLPTERVMTESDAAQPFDKDLGPATAASVLAGPADEAVTQVQRKKARKADKPAVQKLRKNDANAIANKDVSRQKQSPEMLANRKTFQTPEMKQAQIPGASAAGESDSERTAVIADARYRRQFPPVYPRRALELGQQGIVTLLAEVLPDGRPRSLKIARSSGHGLLDKAAVVAVKKWEFEPTHINGSAVISWVKVPVQFVIQ